MAKPPDVLCTGVGRPLTGILGIMTEGRKIMKTPSVVDRIEEQHRNFIKALDIANAQEQLDVVNKALTALKKEE